LPSESAKKKADKEGTRLCVSNPCFEFWALLHFEKTAKLFQDCGAAINSLQPLWQKSFHVAYGKQLQEAKKLYDRLSSRTSDAIDKTEFVRTSHHSPKEGVDDCMPSTDIYVLVRKLLGP